MRIVVFSTCSQGVLTGEEYHAILVAHVLARRGHECYFITNNYPIVTKDLKVISPDNPINFIVDKEFKLSSQARFDVVFIASKALIDNNYYRAALRFAKKTGALKFVLNFESTNWFSESSTTKHPEKNEPEWRFLSNNGCNILCSTHESMKLAKEYYQDLPPGTDISVWKPAINTIACNAIGALPREKKVLFFVGHKDRDKWEYGLKKLLTSEFRGYTFTILLDNQKEKRKFSAKLSQQAKTCGISLESQTLVSDEVKFKLIKSSAAVVSSHNFEGCSYHLLEALASDTPCVTYDLPVIRESCRNLAYYGSVGDIDTIRCQLIKALKSKRQQTSQDPHVRSLTNLEERALDLENIIHDYQKKVRSSSIVGTKVPLIAASKCSIFINNGLHMVCFQLASSTLLTNILGWKSFAHHLDYFPGPWLNGQKLYTVVFSVNSFKSWKDLSKNCLQLHFVDKVLRLELLQLDREVAIPKRLPANVVGIDSLSLNKNSALILGWAYPLVDYDALFYIDKNGRTISLCTNIFNNYSPIFYPLVKSPFGFVGEFNLLERDLSLGTLAFARNGLVVGFVSLNILPMLKTEYLGIIDIGSDQNTTYQSNTSETTESSKTVCVQVQTVKFNNEVCLPIIGAPSMMSLAYYRLKKKFRKLLRRENASFNPLKWVVRPRFNLEKNELIIQGWVLKQEPFKIDIWDYNHLLGSAKTGINRPDISKKFNITTGESKFGFSFKCNYAYKKIKKLRVLLKVDEKLLAEKKIDEIALSDNYIYSMKKKPKEQTVKLRPNDFNFSISSIHYNPKWKILWSQGGVTARNSQLLPVQLEIIKNYRKIAAGLIQTIADKKGIKWRVEEQLDQPVEQSDVLFFRFIFQDGYFVEYTHTLLGVEFSSIMNNSHIDPYLNYARGESLTGLLERESSLKANCNQFVLLIVHNLNHKDRPEKRLVFENIRMNLLSQGKELILLHHNKSHSGANLPEINFFSEKLKCFCDLLDSKKNKGGSRISYLEENGTLEYCKKMLYGFLKAKDSFSEEWNNVNLQVVDEAKKVDTVIRIVKPAAILIWHQWNSLGIVAREVAKYYNIPSAFVHEGLLPGTMTIDEKGMTAEASFVGVTLENSKKNQIYRAHSKQAISIVRNEMLDRKPINFLTSPRKLLSSIKATGKKVVFYAGINDWQSGNLPRSHPKAKVFSPHYVDTYDALEDLLIVAKKLDFYVLFKPHSNLNSFKVPLKENSRLVYIRTANPNECIILTDVTVTILSSLSYNSLCHGKPTVLLGRNSLSGTGAPYELFNKTKLTQVMQQALAKQDLLKRLAFFESHIAALLKGYFYSYGKLEDIPMLSDVDSANKIVSLIHKPKKINWSISEIKFNLEQKELIICGWVIEQKGVQIEVWDHEHFLGIAKMGLNSNEIANKSKTKGDSKLGYFLICKYDHKKIKKIKVLLKVDNKILEERESKKIILFDDFTFNHNPRFFVDNIEYDPVWKVLWLQGKLNATYLGLLPVRLEVYKNGCNIAEGIIEIRTTREKKECKWRVEEHLNQPIEENEKLVFRFSDGDGAFVNYSYSISGLNSNATLTLHEDRHLSYARGECQIDSFEKTSPHCAKSNKDSRDLSYDWEESLVGLLENAVPHCIRYNKLVILVVGNMNVDLKYSEKRNTFEKLRTYLAAKKIELIIFHGVRHDLNINLPEINFFSDKLESLCNLLGSKQEQCCNLISYLEKNGTIEYCKKMLYGFINACYSHPKDWTTITSQVFDEAKKIDTVFRIAKPDTVLIWHQWNSLSTIAQESAKYYNIPSAIVHEGMLPGTMTIDEKGMMAEASCVGVKLEKNKKNEMYMVHSRQVISNIRNNMLNRKSTSFQTSPKKLLRSIKATGKKVVFYAGINDWQSGNLPRLHPTARVHSPHYTDTYDALESLLIVAKKLDFYVVFKPHPKSNLKLSLKTNSRLLYLRAANGNECITLTDVTVTILSQISYNSLCHGKPTVLLGKNTLSGTGAAYELIDKTKLTQVMQQALDKQNLSERLDHFESHIAALLKGYLYPYGGKANFSMLNEVDSVNKITSLNERLADSILSEGNSSNEIKSLMH